MSATEWNTPEVIDHLSDMVTNIEGIQRVVIGVPEALTRRASAYLTVGSHRFGSMGRAQERYTRYLIVFGYLTQGMEATAETSIAGWVDKLQVAILTDITLGGKVAALSIDATLAESPMYATFAGAEARLYPVVIDCLQLQAF